MSARRERGLALAALVVATMLVLLGAGPAAAAVPQGAVTAPGENETVTTATPLVTGEFVQPSTTLGAGRLEKVDLSLSRPEPLEGEPAPPETWVTSIPNEDNDDRLPFEWQVPALAYNGAYVVRAVATGYDRFSNNPNTTTVDRLFRLAVPPVAPTGVATSVNDATAEVAVSWKPNPEPDIVGYQVQRTSVGTTRWVEVATTAKASAVDKPPAGEWRYRVFAVRRGETADKLVPSDASASVGAEVKAPPTTTAPSGDGGGDGTTATTAQGGGGTTPASTAAGGTTATTVPGGRVDFSSFAQLLDQAQARSTPPRRVEPPDPGFEETLPFQPGDEPADALGDEATDDEAGADEDANVVTRLITDESERRRSLSYIAGAFLFFVLMMVLRWLKREADLLPLEQLDPDEAPRDASAPPRRTLADRRAAAAMVVPAGEPAPRRPSARRATRRIPSRPANDRGQGPAPVRPRRRRAGTGDRRTPVG